MIYDEATSKFGGTSIAPQSIKGEVTGDAVEVNGGATCTIIATCGPYVDSAVRFSLMEGDTADGTFSAVDYDEGVIGPVASLSPGDAGKIVIFGYKGYKRYIKVVATPAGTTAGTAIAAAVVVGMARTVPTDDFIE